MATDELNTIINPLKEKSDKIEFTVDKMGLSNPAQTIPTDVDYFLRKQKGELESKFTWSEALSKSFEIDNLIGSGINNFGKEDGYAIDFDFSPTKEMVNSIDKYPEYIRDAFYDAKSEEKIIVALDLDNCDMAMELVNKLEGHAKFFKIGLGLLAKGGLDLAIELKKKDKFVFLDLKLFDIENTIKKAVKEISTLGVDFITVHGDPQVVKAAVLGRKTNDTQILAVTFLTSLDRRDLDQNLIMGSLRK